MPRGLYVSVYCEFFVDVDMYSSSSNSSNGEKSKLIFVYKYIKMAENILRRSKRITKTVMKSKRSSRANKDALKCRFFSVKFSFMMNKYFAFVYETTTFSSYFK